MSFWEKNKGSIIGGASSILGGALGMIGQGKRAKKQHERQKELMGIQFGNQQELNKQGAELQYQMWKDTNYPAQMKMIEEAGLNPALLYGMSGGGATTTGNQGGGNAAGGQAHAPMDIGQAAQVGLMTAQAAKLAAETNKIKEETESEKGSLDNIRSGLNEEQRKQFAYMQTQIQEITHDNLESQSMKAYNSGLKILREKNLLDDTYEEQKSILQKELLLKGLEVELEEENVTKTKQEIEVLSQSIYQRWTEIGIKGFDTLLKGILGGGGVGAIKKLMESFKKAK